MRHAASVLAALAIVVDIGASEPPVPELDLLEAMPMREASGGIVFALTLAAPADAARMRILIDTDGPTKGEPSSGAEFLVEGATLYAYPPGGRAWQWNALEPALWTLSSNRLTCALFNLPLGSGFAWAVETTTADWNIADRIPDKGLRPETTASLPPAPAGERPSPVDLSDLLVRSPPTLTERFEDELGTREWTKTAGIDAFAWSPPNSKSSLPVRLTLIDAASGRRAVLEPDVGYESGSQRRWAGRTLGIDWILVADTDDAGTLTLAAQLEDDTNRVLSIAAEIVGDLSGWTWHDDLDSTRAIEGASSFSTTESLPFGRVGLQSVYLFGVVAKDDTALLVETDPAEPRVYQIAATTRSLGISYDMALSPATGKFPGRAAFRCSFRAMRVPADDAFRVAVASFQERNPDAARRRVPRSGLWMPFDDIGTLPQPEDFGFAFFEKEGTPGADVAYAESNGVLTLLYTEPWVYWLPMPPRMERTEAEALAWMTTIAGRGNTRPNDLAAAALTSAARDATQKIRMTFQDVPWNSGARMETSTDPELPTTAAAPVNRAMVEWKAVQRALSDPRVDGIYLDSMSAMQLVDFHPAAVAVADYPLVYEVGGTQPGVAMPVAHHEFISGLSAYLHERGAFVMGNFPCWNWPFFIGLVDIPGEETTWLHGNAYRSMDARRLAARRVLAGKKPWGFLQAADFAVFDRAIVERYFRDCLYWGFLPSFFSKDGANDPYWRNPALLERDRPLFRMFIPLIRRIADAGWAPIRPFTIAPGPIRAESFGATGVTYSTFRNTSSVPARAVAAFPGGDTDALLVDPFGSPILFLPRSTNTTAVPLRLEPGEVAIRIRVPESEWEREAAAFAEWRSLGREAEAGAASIASILAERRIGLHVRVDVPDTTPANRALPVSVIVSNTGRDTVILSEFAFDGARGIEGLAAGPVAIPAGSNGAVRLELEGINGADRPWIGLRWRAATRDDSQMYRRLWRAAASGGVFAEIPEDRLITVEDPVAIPIRLHNELPVERDIRVRFTGDYDVDPLRVTLAGGSRTNLEAMVASRGRTNDTLRIEVLDEGRTVRGSAIPIEFLPADASIVRDSRVIVEADSTFDGYSLDRLRDGVTDAAGLEWHEAAWASGESASPHWVRIRFPLPTAINEARIVWHAEDGVAYTSRRGEWVGLLAGGGTLPIATFEEHEPVAETIIRFDSVQLDGIELRQPAGGGSPARPNLMWLRELELR